MKNRAKKNPLTKSGTPRVRAPGAGRKAGARSERLTARITPEAMARLRHLSARRKEPVAATLEHCITNAK